MSGWRVNADERRFPKHFLPRHAPRQFKQTARRISESARTFAVESLKKMKRKSKELSSDPLTILVDASLSLFFTFFFPALCHEGY